MLKKMRFIFIILLYLSTTSYANEDIKQIIKDNPRSNIAVLVKDLSTGKELYEHNSLKLMLPGSVTKSFVVYAALEFLKKDFIYKTQILANNNDLYIKFSGDPTLTSKDIEKLIKTIPKDRKWRVFIDDFIFDQNYNADGTTFEDTKFCYAAPSSAIVINKNCFNATLTAANKINNKSILKSVNKYFAKIDNQIMTKKDASCSPHLMARSDNSYILNDCIDIASNPISLNIAYQDPRMMAQKLLADLLVYNNINYFHNIDFKPTPKNAKILSEHSSEALIEILKLMHKNSDNLMANNIAKTIGAYFFGKQASFKTAVQAIKEIVSANSKVDVENMIIFDGAGESRYNLISAEHLVDLYTLAHSNKNIRKDFYDSLSIGAQDGTLKSRLIEFPELHGKLYAKTGTLKSVSSIVGVIDEKVVFAIIFNSSLLPKSQLIKFEAKIILSILNKYAQFK